MKARRTYTARGVRAFNRQPLNPVCEEVFDFLENRT
jgi:hypothetical protein